MKDDLSFAIQLAAQAHAGQRDKAGQPYILHPLAVMAKMDNNHDRIVAVLHDTIEDTFVTASLLSNHFSTAIVDDVLMLTRSQGEWRLTAALRIAKHGSNAALRVKLADVEDNMRLDRLREFGESDSRRIHEYFEVRNALREERARRMTAGDWP